MGRHLRTTPTTSADASFPWLMTAGVPGSWTVTVEYPTGGGRHAADTEPDLQPGDPAGTGPVLRSGGCAASGRRAARHRTDDDGSTPGPLGISARTGSADGSASATLWPGASFVLGDAAGPQFGWWQPAADVSVTRTNGDEPQPPEELQPPVEPQPPVESQPPEPEVTVGLSLPKEVSWSLGIPSPAGPSSGPLAFAVDAALVTPDAREASSRIGVSAAGSGSAGPGRRARRGITSASAGDGQDAPVVPGTGPADPGARPARAGRSVEPAGPAGGRRPADGPGADGDEPSEQPEESPAFRLPVRPRRAPDAAIVPLAASERPDLDTLHRVLAALRRL